MRKRKREAEQPHEIARKIADYLKATDLLGDALAYYAGNARAISIRGSS